jgi:hypothetical protein
VLLEYPRAHLAMGLGFALFDVIHEHQYALSALVVQVRRHEIQDVDEIPHPWLQDLFLLGLPFAARAELRLEEGQTGVGLGADLGLHGLIVQEGADDLFAPVCEVFVQFGVHAAPLPFAPEREADLHHQRVVAQMHGLGPKLLDREIHGKELLADLPVRREAFQFGGLAAAPVPTQKGMKITASAHKLEAQAMEPIVLAGDVELGGKSTAKVGSKFAHTSSSVCALRSTTGSFGDQARLLPFPSWCSSTGLEREGSGGAVKDRSFNALLQRVLSRRRGGR